jgi:hypothetical protein
VLPIETIRIADNFVEAFDSSRPSPMEFNKAAQEALQEASQSGSRRGSSVLVRLSARLAAYLEERTNLVWESLKRAVNATGVKPYPDFAADLRLQIDKHANPLHRAAKDYLNNSVKSMNAPRGASFQGIASFNNLLPRMYAEVELFCADYQRNCRVRTDNAGGPTFNNFTGIYGNVMHSQVTLYDYSSVNQLLIDRQISKQDRRELEDIMDEMKEAPPEKKPSLVKRGEDWIVAHKELLGTAGEAVGKAIGAAMKH